MNPGDPAREAERDLERTRDDFRWRHQRWQSCSSGCAGWVLACAAIAIFLTYSLEGLPRQFPSLY